MYEAEEIHSICFESKPPRPFHKQKLYSCHTDTVVKFMIPIRPGELSIL